MDKLKAKIIKASKALQQKAGTGEIPASSIARAEEMLEKNAEDFSPLARQFLDRLKNAVDFAYSEHEGMENHRDLIVSLTKPVMDLKANARMFKYNLVTNLANIMLDFLEGLTKLDKTAIDIVGAHVKTLSLIVNRRMAGSGGDIGATLEKELRGAVSRYYAQKNG